MRIRPVRWLGVWILLLPSLAWSQIATDVCCVLGMKEGQGVQMFAEVRSSTDCRRGQKAEEFTVCAAIPDPENLCPTYENQDLCQKCGYHWTGGACLVEDPVKAAKEQLKQEKADKAASQKR